MAVRNGKTHEERELLINIAKRYYFDGLSQEAIAKECGLSRPTISRALSRCIDEGIVSIEIRDVSFRLLNLASALEKKYGLKKAIVVEHVDPDVEALKSRAARAAANYLTTQIKDNFLIGLPQGTTIMRMLDYMQYTPLTNVNTIQLVGIKNSTKRSSNALYIATEFARMFGGNAHVLPAPIHVQSKVLRDLLMEEPSIIQHFNMFRKIDFAVVGIGAPEAEWETSNENEVFDRSENENGYYMLRRSPFSSVNEIRNSNAVGTVCSNFYDADGNVCNLEFNTCEIAIGVDDLRSIPEILGVAVGSNKVQAIKGALLGGFVNSLVTDEHVAIELLRN